MAIMISPKMPLSKYGSLPLAFVGCLALSYLQVSGAWTSKEILSRRNIIEFAGWSALTTFVAPSVAEDGGVLAASMPEVEVVASGDAKKVR
jgi:hypothetical protein